MCKVVHFRLRRPGSQALLQDLANQELHSYQLSTPNTIHLADTIRLNVFRALSRNVTILGFHDAWLTNEALSPFNMHRPPRQLGLSGDDVTDSVAGFRRAPPLD